MLSGARRMKSGGSSSGSSENTPLLNGSHEGPCYAYSDAASVDEEEEDEDEEESLKRVSSVLGHLKKAPLVLLVLFCIVCLNFVKTNDFEWKRKTLSSGKAIHMNVTADVDLSKETIHLRLRGPFVLAGTSTLTFALSKMSLSGLEEKISQSWTVLLDTENKGNQIELHHDFLLSDEDLSESNTYLLSVISDKIVNDIQLDIDLSIRSKLSIEKLIMAVSILIVFHILLIFELLHRSLATMLVAMLTVSCLALVGERPSTADVIGWLDAESLCLVLGLLLFTSIICETGFFEFVAVLIYRSAGGYFWILFTFLCALTALLSALLDPLSTIIFMTSLTLRLSESMNIDPKYVLVAIVHFSHFGGILRYSSNSFEIPFDRFLLHLFPVVLLVMLTSYGFWRFWLRDTSMMRFSESLEVVEVKREQEVWKKTHLSLSTFSREEANVKAILKRKVTALDTLLRKKLYDSKMSAEDSKENLKELANTMKVKNRSLLYKSVVVGVALLGLLFLRNVPSLNLSSGWIALLIAVLLLVLLDGNSNVESALNRVEWPTLLFLASFYVFTQALVKLDIVEYMTDLFFTVMMNASSFQLISIVFLIWMSALSSTFAIPFSTAMMAALKNNNTDSNPLIFALTLGVYLGGNASLLGGSVNIVSAGMAEQHGCPYSYCHFFKLGFPVMLLTVSVSMAYLLMCHVWLGWND